MAKAKQQELSIEEKLEKALVPEDEQPYEVPSNWVWFYCTSLFDIVYGKGLPTKELKDEGYPVFGANGYIGYYDTYMYDKEQVLMSCRGAYSGTINITVPFSFVTNNSLILNCRCTEMHYKFIAYLFNSLDKSRLISGSAQPQVTVQAFDGLPLLIPPLAEQQRIIDRIESLFEKLDNAKELAQNALDTFETRKAAILHKAFTSELTAKWREKNGIGMGSWENKTLGDVCESFQYGTSKKSVSNGEVVVVRMGNLQNGEITWDDLAFTDDKEDMKKYMLKPGDVLFNRTNSPELVGKTAIYRGEFPAIFAGYLIRLNYTNKLNGSYLNYVMNSPSAKEYCSLVKSDGVNQSNINAKKIACFTLPVPTILEQKEIVRILDNIFEQEKKAKELCDVIEKIDLLKKVILARAFRGEMGTNDPSEESALELLSSIL